MLEITTGHPSARMLAEQLPDETKVPDDIKALDSPSPLGDSAAMNPAVGDSDKPAVLLLTPLPPATQAKLAERYRVVLAPNDPAAQVSGSGLATDVRALVTVGGAGVDRQLLALLPNLGLVCEFGTGYDQADTEALDERHIPVATGAGANAPCVADLAMALLLACALRVLSADRLVRKGDWVGFPVRGWTASPGFGGKRLGVLGLGSIGTRVGRRAESFDLDVGYHSRHRKESDYRYFDDLLAMAEWADYLVVACPLTAATHHLVNAAVLTALGPSGYLVNVARGAVVDQNAMIAALRDGRIAGAGLDVLEDEPTVPAALRNASNVVLTPHIGAFTLRSAESMGTRLLENLEAFFSADAMSETLRTS